MKVNELEKQLGISRANIRYYESEGFIQPSRSENGYRNYSSEDAELLKKVIVYRKLGLSIAEIKSVFSGEISLKDAVSVSIKNLQDSIDSQNVAIAICEEIKAQDINNKEFDADYFLSEISSYEATGEEFVDVASIDITPFQHQNRIKILIIVLIALFFFGVAYALLCHNLFILNDNENFKSTLPEIITADTIDTVKADKNNDRIYVFYDEASCINTYSFSGEFLWAVSVPEIKDRGMCYFYLTDNKIVLDNRNTVYLYDAISGTYLDMDFAENMGLYEERDRYDAYHQADIEQDKAQGITFDYYNVYLMEPNGAQRVIVSKPFSVLLQNDSFGFVISLLAALGLAIIAYISRLRLLNRIAFHAQEVGKMTKVFRIVILCMAALYLLLAVLILLFSIFNLQSITVGIFPAGLSFAVLLLVNSALKLKINASEKKVLGTSLHYCVLSFVLLFLSTLISVIFFQ